MNKKQTTRVPVQERGRETRESIVQAGLELFSKKGYYKTNSKEIARAAGVSIGSFYAYFPDKKDLFHVVLQVYMDSIKESLKSADINSFISTGDHRGFLRLIVERLIETHKIYPDLHQEVEIMAHSDPEIRKIMKKSKDESFAITRHILSQWKDKTDIADIDAAAIVIEKSMESIVHTLMFSNLDVDHERVINELVDMVHSYLFKGGR